MNERASIASDLFGRDGITEGREQGTNWKKVIIKKLNAISVPQFRIQKSQYLFLKIFCPSIQQTSDKICISEEE